MKTFAATASHEGSPAGMPVTLDASPVDVLGPITISLGVHARGLSPSVSLYADNFAMTTP